LRQHPTLGATWAARLGVAPRACALIAAHQDGDANAFPTATEVGEPRWDVREFARVLAALRWADDHA